MANQHTVLKEKGRPQCCGRPMRKFGFRAGTKNVRWKCSACNKDTTNPDKPVEDRPHNPAHAKHLRGRKLSSPFVYFITSATNNADVDRRHLESVMAFCEHRGAELIVIPIHYKNVSLFNRNEKKWWHPSITKYLMDERMRLHRNVTLAADIKVQPTAANPLAGKHALTKGKFMILGHPQVALEPVATPGNKLPGRLYTTGSITARSYSRTNAGAKGRFNHSMGGIIVESDGPSVWVRQAHFDKNGGFYDLDTYYSPQGHKKAGRPLALVLGDEHVKWVDEGVKEATYLSKESIVKSLRPKALVHHDIIDGYAGSHHHLKDPLVQFKKMAFGEDDYRAELEGAVSYLHEVSPKDTETLIVPSNHQDHLTRWLNETNPNKDVKNIELWMELRALQAEAIRTKKRTEPLLLYFNPRLKIPFKYLDRNEPYLIGQIDVSQHGDSGSNGSRGSARGFANVAHKSIIGHSHGARIVKGVYQVGNSCVKLEYEKGLSDHSHTHCLIYPNGKRTLIDIFSKKWRA